MLARYFDNAATTPVDPRVREAMVPYLGEECGNANSIHSFGLAARAAIEKAREQVATLIGADDPSEIVFTSGATESNNWVIRAFEHVVTSPLEHSSIHDISRSQLPYGEAPFIAQYFDLQSVMWVNNETGAIYGGKGPKEFDFARTAARFHSDATQAVGKLPVSVDGLDFLSLSAHKFHGPKGVGALFVRGGVDLVPLLVGGGHERGLRAGTLNVPGIVGLGEAARIAIEEREQDFVHASQLKEALLREIQLVPDHRVIVTITSPFILAVSFSGIEGETVVVDVDRRGFAIGAGAACSTGNNRPSHVLQAMGIEPEWARGTIRISFGRFNTVDETVALAKALSESVAELRGIVR